MTATEVHRMVSDVIVHQGLPFTVTSVTAAAGGWDVIVKSAGTGMLQFTLPGSQPTRMRIVIQELLEAQL